MLRTVLLSLAAVALSQTASAQPARDTGEALVQRNCSQCHAITRTDKSPLRDAPAFRDLTLNYPMEDLAEALAEGILTGHPAMPEFRFEPSEVKAIIRYLQSIQSKQDASWRRDLP